MVLGYSKPVKFEGSLRLRESSTANFLEGSSLFQTVLVVHSSLVQGQ